MENLPISSRPDDVALQKALVENDRAATLHAAGHYEEALAAYDRAVALAGDYAQIHLNRGLTLHALKRFKDALSAYDRAISLKPDFADAFNNCGNSLRELRQHGEALKAYDRAIALQPKFAEAYNNRGNALRSLRRHIEALTAYDRAIALKPDFAQAHYHRGFALQELNRTTEALASFDAALALDPTYADAQWSKAFVHLLMGDFVTGWPLYEWRWQRFDGIAPQRTFSQPLWRGDFDIQDKTIFIYAEQGLGDTIQFCRYAKLAADRGAKVILEVPVLLQALMTSLEGVQQLNKQGDPLPPFDCHCPLLSMPLAFNTKLSGIPAGIPYLHAPKDAINHWTSMLGERRSLRVGLAWAGNPDHRNDRNRSMKLIELLPLNGSGVELFSLQKEMPRAEAVILAATPSIKNIGLRFGDFTDTAAAIALMDVVITVDTAIAHLAGALGKPVWILLPFAPEWRWLQDRADSPWYPTARLFRQTRMGDWLSVVDTVGKELHNLR